MLGVCITLSGGTLDTQWEFVLSNFEIDELYLLGGAEPSSKLMEAGTRISSIAEIDHPVVVMAPLRGRYVQGEIPLNEFKHPEDAVYVFGSDKLHMELDTEPEHKVYIPTATKDEMYSHVAAAVTLWDRLHG